MKNEWYKNNVKSAKNGKMGTVKWVEFKEIFPENMYQL